MNRNNRRDVQTRKTPESEIPPGATRAAFDREDNGGGTRGSPLGDPHAAGTPAGGDEWGGLAGSNIGDGSPLEDEEREQIDQDEENGPFAGHAGGAVGGTPANDRASGGRMEGHGFSPGTGSTRGDSTIGASSDSDNKPARKRNKKK